jgi:hypothetical protein
MTSHPPRSTTNRLHSIHQSAKHLRVWLTASGLSYGGAARERFVRAHPVLFGSAYELTLRGYQRWRTRHDATDTLEAFARYIARRHQRWMDSMELTPAVAPCLIGSSGTAPCWLAPDGVADRRAA